MKNIWVLVTGARDLRHPARAREILRAEFLSLHDTYSWDSITLVHGAADGIDTIAREVAFELGIRHEPWRAGLFPTPLIRNKFMVNLVVKMKELGDDAVCWAFARRWASGTGNCAREARRAGLHVVDFGVSTEDRNPF